MMQASRAAGPRVVCFGEILLRLAAPRPQLLLQRDILEPTVCGAEANVAVNLSGLGHNARMVTALPGNQLGEAAQRAIASHGVEVNGCGNGQGRLGLYFLQPGAMKRPASIVYDREGSAFAKLDPAHIDWNSLLEGTDWLFVGGITAALGEGPLAALRAGIASARAMGVKVAFDTNFRPALWKGREAQAAQILRELSLQSELVFAGRRAVAMMLGGSFDHEDGDAGFAAAADALFAQTQTLQYMAATRRVVHSSDRQDITGLLADRAGVTASKTIALENVVDRIGTGDAFAAGIVHGILSGLSRDATIDFAAACAEWAHSVVGDFMLASLADIDALASGTGDVRR